MNGDKADRDEKKSQDQGPPIDKGVSTSSGKDQTCTENLERKAKYKYQGIWPDWILAVASIIFRPNWIVKVISAIFQPDWILAITSIILAIATIFYVGEAWEQNELTREALNTSRRSLSMNRNMWSTSRDAFYAARKTARLEQRPWVGYYDYGIQARENTADRWEYREPKMGEQFRVRFFVQNVGKTPALNVQLMSIVPRLVPVGTLPKIPDKWSSSPNRIVLFPKDEGLSHNTKWLVLTDEQFLEYSTLRKEVFFWMRLYYCDLAKERHWTEAGISHVFGTNEYRIVSSSVGTMPVFGVPSILGGPGHPDCED